MKVLKFIFTVCVLFVCGQAKADDHIFSLRYMADPYSFVSNGRLYIFGSHDRFEPGTKYIIKDIICISTDDMKNWTDHGVVFKATDSKWGAKLTWAPAVAERDGTFFLYYGDGDKGIGVATSKNLTGPYVDDRNGPLITRSTPGVLDVDKDGKTIKPEKNLPGAFPGSEDWGFWCFDPGILIDDDGQVYMYFGGANPANSRVIKLKKNMIEADGSAVKVNTPGFFEASFIHKYKGTYYLSYSGHYFNMPANIDYVTSKHPMKGFDNVAMVMKNPPNNDGFNHHQAIFEFNGQWYMVYHNRQMSASNGVSEVSAREFLRNLCLDYLYYNEDGSIKEVKYTQDGVKQIKNINPFQWNEAETMASAGKGLSSKPFAGGRYINEIRNGSWIKVRGVDFGNVGAKEFTVSVASDNVGGFLEVRLGSPTGKVMSRLAFGNTGGWENWKEISGKTEELKGVQDVYFVFHGDVGELFTFDKWKFN